MNEADIAHIDDPAHRAARILQAWRRGDEAAFRREVAMTLNLPIPGSCLIEEQAEVLQTVAACLDRCPELLSDGHTRPDGRACAALLAHLAGRS